MIDILEELEERIRRPFGRKPQQIQQIPHLDGVHLHRGRSQQHQALRVRPELPHQCEQSVRAALLPGARRAPPGMVRFVEHHQIPGLGLLK